MGKSRLIRLVRVPLVAVCVAGLVAGVSSGVVVAKGPDNPQQPPEPAVAVVAASGSLAAPDGQVGQTAPAEAVAWPAAGGGRVEAGGSGMDVRVLGQQESAPSGLAGVVIGVPGTVVERVDLVPEGGGGQHVLVVCVRVGFGGQGRCSRCG